jgi:hypothetical protein
MATAAYLILSQSALLLGGLALCLLLAMAVASPLGTLLVLTSLRVVSDQTFKLSLTAGSDTMVNTHSILAFSIWCVFAFLLVTGRFHRTDTLLTTSIGIFLFSCTLSLFASGDALYDVLDIARLSTWLLLLLAATALTRTERDFKTWSRVASLTSLVPVSVGLYQLSGYGLTRYYAGVDRAVAGMFGTSHTFAASLLLLIPPLTYGFHIFRRHRMVFLALIGTCSVLVFFTFVRHAWLALLTFFVCLVLLHFRIRSLWLLLIVLLLFAGLVGLEQESVSVRFQDIDAVDAYSWDELGSGRVGIWKRTVAGHLDSDWPRMLFGHGSAAILETTGGFVAHNDFLDCLFRFGLVGLLAYILLLTVLFRRLWSAYTQTSDAPFLPALALSTFAVYLVGALTNGYLFRLTAMYLLSWTIGGCLGIFMHRRHLT